MVVENTTHLCGSCANKKRFVKLGCVVQLHEKTKVLLNNLEVDTRMRKHQHHLDRIVA